MSINLASVYLQNFSCEYLHNAHGCRCIRHDHYCSFLGGNNQLSMFGSCNLIRNSVVTASSTQTVQNIGKYNHVCCNDNYGKWLGGPSLSDIKFRFQKSRKGGLREPVLPGMLFPVNLQKLLT